MWGGIGLNCTMIALLMLVVGRVATAAEGERLSNLNAQEVWYPHRDFPKFTTPQWVGEAGVECVIVLAIDDLRDSAKYEAYLRPILQRLKAIDGRAPVSIMSCSVRPEDPQLQAWLQEGVSLECHTFDHPCPLLAGGMGLQKTRPATKETTSADPSAVTEVNLSPLQRSKATYDKCVDLMAAVPNNKPVAFRTPCCDSLNTLSPRFFSEIFRQTTPSGNWLQLDSSVFMLYTANDPSIPEGWLTDDDGREKFRKYLPRKLQQGDVVHDGFVNTIENYPYPYVIQQSCWEFPCMVPSDWSANHLHQPNNPATVRDLKIALDITVLKQGVMNVVFHPHGWIKPEQVVELIDHAVSKHGHKVKFLNFQECVARLNQNVLGDRELRQVPQLRFRDLNGDGRMDIVREMQIDFDRETPIDFSLWNDEQRCWTQTRRTDVTRIKEFPEIRIPIDVDGDGTSEEFWFHPDKMGAMVADKRLPAGVRLWSETGVLWGTGTRLVDLNDDGQLDLIVSNASRYGAWLLESADKGWTIELVNSERGKHDLTKEFPPIIQHDGSDNGFFVRDRALCWINEDTSHLPDLCLRIPFDTILGDRLPEAKSPAMALKSMRVQPGYQIELVASEPMTMDPVAFDWGPDGKLWIAEMADYPLGPDAKGTPGGRVRFLEDTDGDGRYDKSTLFLDKVAFPNGVLAWKNGVLISAAPEIFYAEDTDGDGRADHREVLFTGFVEGNQQHRVNGFTRGLDNWLYLANGDSGGRVKSTMTGREIDLSGCDVRLRPATGEIEAVAGQSQFGRNRDDWGNWFGNNNSRPMWHFVLDDHYLRRNPFLAVPTLIHDVSVTPGAAPVFPSSKTLTRFNDFHTANRFTSACSAIVYRDDLLFRSNPEGSSHHLVAGEQPRREWHTFVSEPVHNLVHHEVMTSSELSFTSQRAASEEQSEFVSSTDNWFRPTMLRTGPDGALWIADMYRQVIEHPQWIPIEWQRKLDVRAGQDKGRIWRVVPIGHAERPILRMDTLSISELVAALYSPHGTRRDLAQQLLIDQADPAAIPLLQRQAVSTGNGPGPDSDISALCRLHSLCTLEGLKDGLTPDLLDNCLADPHAGVRRHVLRLCETSPKHSAKRLAELAKLVDDQDPQVRLQLAYTLGEIKIPEADALLGRLARRTQGEMFMTAAVISSLNARNLEAVLSEVVKSGDEQTELLQTLLGQATLFQHEPALVALLNRATEPGVEYGFARWQFAAINQFLISLERRGESLDQWLQGLSVKSQKMATRLDSLFAAARKLATNPDAAVADRKAAVLILGQSASADDDLGLLSELFTPQQSPELQSAALASLVRLKTPAVARILLANYRSFTPSLRTQTSQALLAREAWRDELLVALESKQLAPADLSATSRQQLLSDRSDTVRERATRILAVDVHADRTKLVAEFLPTVRMGGDAQHGSQLFKKTCSQCHKLGDVGHAVGPDLRSLTDKSPDAMLTAILDPNRAVETRFLTFTVVTKAGVTHAGIMAAESSSSITLRAAEGKEVTLLRLEIDELQSSPKSLMPEGLERDLKPTDLAALITYIRLNVPLPALKKFAGNEPRTVQADADGTLTLTPYEAEIYGSTIVIEEPHRNLGWWSSADDIVVWTINVPKAGSYAVSWSWACDPQSAGNHVTIEALGKTITREVSSTANWDDYQTEDLGELPLPAGEVRLTMKPASRPLPALGDVKFLVLRLKP